MYFGRLKYIIKKKDGSRDGQAGWTSYSEATQELYSLKLKPRGTIRLKSAQTGGYHESQTGGWTSSLVAKDAKVRVRKQL
jgi:hypothetical protein